MDRVSIAILHTHIIENQKKQVDSINIMILRGTKLQMLRKCVCCLLCIRGVPYRKKNTRLEIQKQKHGWCSQSWESSEIMNFAYIRKTQRTIFLLWVSAGHALVIRFSFLCDKSAYQQYHFLIKIVITFNLMMKIAMKIGFSIAVCGTAAANAVLIESDLNTRRRTTYAAFCCCRLKG